MLQFVKNVQKNGEKLLVTNENSEEYQGNHFGHQVKNNDVFGKYIWFLNFGHF